MLVPLCLSRGATPCAICTLLPCDFYLRNGQIALSDGSIRTLWPGLRMSEKRRATSNLSRVAWTVAGTLVVGLGILGIFLPILPTIPFLLLAAICYARGSEGFYNWLLNNKLFGRYIRDYREGKGIPFKVKVLTICLVWIAIGCSAAFAVHALAVRLILIIIAIGVTAYILSIRTLRQ